MLPSLSCILTSLIVNKNWLLEQHTLEAFTQFAEVRSIYHIDLYILIFLIQHSKTLMCFSVSGVTFPAEEV